jgi:hypothetical protein
MGGLGLCEDWVYGRSEFMKAGGYWKNGVMKTGGYWKNGVMTGVMTGGY